MALQELVPLIIVGSVWILIGITILISLLVNRRPDNALEQIYDQCTSSSAYCNYLIKFVFGSPQHRYDISHDTIAIDILNSFNRQMTRFTILPEWIIEKSNPIDITDHRDARIVKFQLNRTIPLNDIDKVRISHDCYGGEIYVISVEIHDMNSGIKSIANVNNYIGFLTPKMKSGRQVYTCEALGQQNIDPHDLKPSSLLSCTEMLTHIFFMANLVLILSMFIIPCKEGFCPNFEGDNSTIKGLFAGISSGITSACSMAIVAGIFRWIIRNNYSKNNGNTLWYSIRLSFLGIIVFIGFTCGIVTAAMGSNRLKDKYTPWIVAVFIGALTITLLWMPIIVIVGYFLGFFHEDTAEPMQVQDKREFPVASQGMGLIAMVKSGSKMPQESETSIGSTGSKYYHEMIGQSKIKSVSQYNQLKKVQKGKEPSTKITNKPSHESTGSEYYNQLMSSGKGKVKSVSQYVGIKKV